MSIIGNIKSEGNIERARCFWLHVRGIKVLEVCLSIHKGCFMFDSFFGRKLALMKIMIIPAKSHYTLKDGLACSANFVGVRILGGVVLTK